MTQIVTQTGFAPDAPLVDAVSLADYKGEPALCLSVDDDIDTVSGVLDTIQMIVIPFSSSADGRGFSLAADLRARGYRGHLRAQGHILVDQFRAALRCGFDDIEISDDQAARNPEHQWQAVSHADGYLSRLFA